MVRQCRSFGTKETGQSVAAASKPLLDVIARTVSVAEAIVEELKVSSDGAAIGRMRAELNDLVRKVSGLIPSFIESVQGGEGYSRPEPSISETGTERSFEESPIVEVFDDEEEKRDIWYFLRELKVWSICAFTDRKKSKALLGVNVC